MPFSRRGSWSSFVPLLSLVVAAGAACSESTGGPAGALFELPRGGPISEYYALPFPNDLRVREDGTLDLDQVHRDNQILTEYFQHFDQEFSGFSGSAASFFRFDALIDTRTLPKNPSASLENAASVYLVNVDPDSPSRGERIPLRFRFEPLAQTAIGENWLACLPFPGFAMRPLTTYAVVVTRRLHATDGSAVKRPADFELVVADADAGGDPAVTRAREVYAPLLAWLDEPGGDERKDVVSASVFTTGDPTSLMGKLRDVMRAQPVPELREIEKTKQNRYVTYFEATYDGPIFQTGEPPYFNGGGGIEVNEAGLPIVQRTDPIRIGIAVPPGDVPPDGWPVVIYAHGTGGDHTSFYDEGLAARFAEQGIAVVGIDQNMNGARVPSGSTAEQAFYNYVNPLAGRDNSRQGAADHFTLVYLLENLVLEEAADEENPKTHPARSHTFNAGKMHYFGHSQGGITGPLFIPFEPGIRSVVLSGAGGLLYWALLQKKEPVDIAGLLGTLIRDFPLDEFNSVLALIQMFIEPADPINYARLITMEPPEGGTAKDVFQTEGFVDSYTPNSNIEALAIALGGQLVGPEIQPVEGFIIDERPALTAPTSANLDGRTVVLLQYAQDSGSDGHFVIFDRVAAQQQSLLFVVSNQRDGVATVVEP